MKIALASMDQLWGNKEGNFRSCVELAKCAKNYGAEVIIFPELTLTGYFLDSELIGEPLDDSHTLLKFGELAKELMCTVVFGACLIDRNDSMARNFFCVAQPDGSSEAIYAKIHTFSHAGEDQVIASGTQVKTFKVSEVTFGASVCYDLRFPALYASMSNDSDCGVVIANWPHSRKDHWFALMKARAIENQMYMIGVNRVGKDGNEISYSMTSCVVSPYGDFEAPIFIEGAISLFEIDTRVVDQYRKSFPTLRDRRLDIDVF